MDADTAEIASANLLELAARWSPASFAALLGSALELAEWEGREGVFEDGNHALSEPLDDGLSFSAEATRQSFAEQIEFLRQKRPKPTQRWTDAMKGVHDRAFVVAGATDIAMLEEFQAAIISAAETYDRKAFEGEFDRIVEKYGWSYKGERDWRIRTILETNIRTSYMAGRLKQMRASARTRPYWQYRHAETRVPEMPRKSHVAWNGLVLRHDDPWWDTHFPPNDWLCSCGVRSLSEGDLKRLGKTGPDEAPRDPLLPVIDRSTGHMVMKPQGIGMGWDYQPGNLWERGLVPSALIDEAGGATLGARHVAQIDAPEPMEELVRNARPFTAQPMAEDLTPEEYVRGFLEPFGADIGRAVLHEDQTGTKLPISEELFKTRDGQWKVGKRARATLTPLLAEALMSPDEIWLGVATKPDPIDANVEELLIDRRYIRVDPETGLIVVFEIGRTWWEAVTGYFTSDRRGRPDLKLLDRRRGGKLLWKRKGRQE